MSGNFSSSRKENSGDFGERSLALDDDELYELAQCLALVLGRENDITPLPINQDTLFNSSKIAVRETRKRSCSESSDSVMHKSKKRTKRDTLCNLPNFKTSRDNDIKPLPINEEALPAVSKYSLVNGQKDFNGNLRKKAQKKKKSENREKTAKKVTRKRKSNKRTKRDTQCNLNNFKTLKRNNKTTKLDKLSNSSKTAVHETRKRSCSESSDPEVDSFFDIELLNYESKIKLKLKKRKIDTTLPAVEKTKPNIEKVCLKDQTEEYSNRQTELFSHSNDLSENVFVKYLHIVFNENIVSKSEYMGAVLKMFMEESKCLIEPLSGPQEKKTSSVSLNESNLIEEDDSKIQSQISLQNCKLTFIKLFSEVYEQLNHCSIIGTHYKQSLLVVWFVIVFVRIVSLEKRYIIDTKFLNEVRTNVVNLLAEQIVRWPLLSKVFVKNESEFESDCCAVTPFVKDLYSTSTSTNDTSCEDIVGANTLKEFPVFSQLTNINQQDISENSVQLDNLEIKVISGVSEIETQCSSSTTDQVTSDEEICKEQTSKITLNPLQVTAEKSVHCMITSQNNHPINKMTEQTADSLEVTSKNPEICNPSVVPLVGSIHETVEVNKANADSSTTKSIESNKITEQKGDSIEVTSKNPEVCNTSVNPLVGSIHETVEVNKANADSSTTKSIESNKITEQKGDSIEVTSKNPEVCNTSEANADSSTTKSIESTEESNQEKLYENCSKTKDLLLILPSEPKQKQPVELATTTSNKISYSENSLKKPLATVFPNKRISEAQYRRGSWSELYQKRCTYWSDPYSDVYRRLPFLEQPTPFYPVYRQHFQAGTTYDWDKVHGAYHTFQERSRHSYKSNPMNQHIEFSRRPKTTSFPRREGLFVKRY